MSYSFVVEVKDGKPSIAENTPVLQGCPDGKIQVAGHVPAKGGTDYKYESISVTRYDDAGSQVSQASASVKQSSIAGD